MKLNDQVYMYAKWLAQIFLPAAGALYFSLSDLWSLPKPLEVVGTLAAVGTFIGLVLGLSSYSYKKENEVRGGYLYQDGADPDTGNPNLGLVLTKMPADILSKKTITLKVDSPPVSVQPTSISDPTVE